MSWSDESPSDLGRAASSRLAELTASEPADPGAIAVAFAPGRVNLIGEHVDHAGGPVLPFAIDLGIAVAAAPSPSPERAIEGPPARVRLRSDRTVDAGSIAILESVRRHVWPDGPRLDFAAAASLPAGAGLASSAAFAIAAMLATGELKQRAERDRADIPARPPGVPALPAPASTHRHALGLARTARAVEHDALGVPCGLMDPLSVTVSRPDHLTWIDAESGAFRHVPFEPGREALGLLLVDSGTRHRHATGAYERRLEELGAAAEVLGGDPWPWLAASHAADEKTDALPEPLARRARHVLTEIRRVDTTVRELEDGHLEHLGTMLDAGHGSLRDDFDVSTPEIERLRDVVLASDRAAVLGCRLIGGGFGGCLLAVGPRRRLAGLARTIEHRGTAALARRVRTRFVQPCGGARLLASAS